MLTTAMADRGVLLVVSTSLVWPAIAGLVVTTRRGSQVPAWRVFLRTGLAAVVAAAALFAWSYLLFRSNGTSQAMASLGPQIAALVCVGGALICAIVAVVLRALR